MILSPDSNLEVENHSLVEAQLSTGVYPWLDLVVRRWAMLLEDTLYYELRIMSVTRGLPVVWKRFEDFLNHDAELPIFILDTVQKRKALLLLEISFLRFLTRKHDSEGESEPSLQDMLKAHQKRLLTMIRPFIRDFERSWQKIGEYPLQIKRITTHPKRAQVMLPFERCLVIQVELKMGEFKTRLTLGLPFSEFHSFLTETETRRVLPPESLEHYHEDIEQKLMQILSRSGHSFSAQLGTIDLRDTGGRLVEGQVVPMNSEGMVNIVVNGSHAFQGELGTSGGKYSVQVKSRIQNENRSSLNQAGDFKRVNWFQS